MRDINGRLKDLNQRRHGPNVFDPQQLIQNVQAQIAQKTISGARMGSNLLGSMASGSAMAGGMFNSPSLMASGATMSAISSGVRKAAEMAAKRKDSPVLSPSTPVNSRPVRESSNAAESPVKTMRDHIVGISKNVEKLVGESKDQTGELEEQTKEQKKEHSRQEKERDKAKEGLLEQKRSAMGTKLSAAASSVTDVSAGGLAAAGGMFDSQTLITSGLAIKAIADMAPKLKFLKNLKHLRMLTLPGLAVAAAGFLGEKAYEKIQRERGLNELEEQGVLNKNRYLGRDELNFERISQGGITAEQADFIFKNASLSRDDKKRFIETLQRLGMANTEMKEQLDVIIRANAMDEKRRQRRENGPFGDAMPDLTAQELEAQRNEAAASRRERLDRRGQGAGVSQQVTNQVVSSPSTNINIGAQKPLSGAERLKNRAR